MSKTIIVFGIIFLLVVLGYIKYHRNRLKLRKLNESRPKLTRTEYIDILVKSGFEKLHVEIVHDQILEFVQMGEFSIYPEDNINEVYGVEGLDIVELMDRICANLNLRKVEQKDCDELSIKMESFNAEYILTLISNLAKDISAT